MKHTSVAKLILPFWFEHELLALLSANLPNCQGYFWLNSENPFIVYLFIHLMQNFHLRSQKPSPALSGQDGKNSYWLSFPIHWCLGKGHLIGAARTSWLSASETGRPPSRGLLPGKVKADTSQHRPFSVGAAMEEMCPPH